VEEPLVGCDNSGRPVPTLGRWTIIDGGKIVEFKLRPGIKFHSGDPLTAADVVFSIERSMADSASFRSYYRGNFDHAAAVNPSTVRFYFKTANVSLIYARNLYIGSKAYYDRVGEKDYVAAMNGTGPYKLVTYKAGQYADLEAFDGYWGVVIRRSTAAALTCNCVARQRQRAGTGSRNGPRVFRPSDCPL
jgi:peptide/nickel transport system substrate-binding protein